MPTRGAHSRRLVPSGLSDAIDGTGAFPGAMAMLGNLIPQPNARGVFVPRPAMVPQASLPDWGGGPVTALESVGNLFYGMVSSRSFPGLDRPFVYNAALNTFAPISGVVGGNLPVSQATVGDWTPPTIAQVAGRIVFTHPGFAGGLSTPPFAGEFFGQVTAASTALQIGYGAVPILVKGTLLYGGFIPAGASVVTTDAVTVTVNGTGTATATTFTVTSAAGLWVGMAVLGQGLAATVIQISGTTITVNASLGQSFTAEPCTFYGTSVTMSAAATGTAAEIVTASSTVANKFGWLDISGFNTKIVGNTIGVGTPVVTGGFSITGIQPGMTIVGSNIGAGTLVQQAQSVAFVVNCATTLNSQVVNPVNGFTLSAIAVGQTVTGTGIRVNTTVAAVNLATGNVTLSRDASANGDSAPLTFSGSFLVLSQGATGAVNGASFTVAGGTPAAPLWGAGDLNINPIASTGPPVFVAEFSNRAYFGVNTPQTSGVQASDAGSACVQTFITQTLLFDNAVPVTTAAQLPLFNVSGGVIQSLMVFQSDTNIQQITGDFSAANIFVNTLPIATGTLSPNSIASSPRGLLFAATDGLRLITFTGAVTDPLGEHGQGLVLPFINMVTPTRTSAAFNENVYRMTISWQPPPSVQSVWGAAVRTDEFWFHLADLGQGLEHSRWSGPHTSVQDLLEPWPGTNGFLAAPQGGRGSLYRSDPKPLAISAYAEFGVQLSCTYQSVLTPDNQDGMANSSVETTIWLGLVSGSEEILVTATDDFQQVLDSAYVWITAISAPAHRAVTWHTPLVYRQMSLSLTARATAALQLGMIVFRESELGYQLPYPVPQEFVLGQAPPLGDAGALGP